MRRSLAALVLVVGIALPATARNDAVTVRLSEVLEMPEAKEKLDGSVRFFTKGEKTPRVEQQLRSASTRRSTNGLGKADDFGCRWSVLSALMALEKQAKSVGANAVIEIESGEGGGNPGEIQCNAGSVVIRTSLRGIYAVVGK